VASELSDRWVTEGHWLSGQASGWPESDKICHYVAMAGSGNLPGAPLDRCRIRHVVEYNYMKNKDIKLDDAVFKKVGMQVAVYSMQ